MNDSKQHLTRLQRSTAKTNDTGLSLLLLLYHFLRTECADAAYLLLIKGFKDSRYQDFIKPDSHTTLDQISFYDFLVDIQRCGKKQDKTSQKSRGPVKDSSKKVTQIHNLTEHEVALKKVTLENLRIGDEVTCQALKDLDLSFMLIVIANEFIQYSLSENVRDAVLLIKDVRNKLVHPKYNFNKEDFDQNLSSLVNATEVLYNLLKPSASDELRRYAEDLQKQISQADIGPHILDKLASEIHPKYMKQQNFVNPVVVDLSNKNKQVIEDFPRYVLDHSFFSSNKVPPMLLCGAPGTGKSTLLQNLAYSLSQQPRSNDLSEFQLVLYLDEWSRKSNRQSASPTISSSSELWEQIFKCMTVLGQKTIKDYGLESVKVVIKEYINRILFIVNWNSRSLGPLFKDMLSGTWIVAYQEREPHTRDWQVLKIKSFSENMVIQFLRKCASQSQEHLISLFNNWQYKEILISPDMIKVFIDLNSSAACYGTDFELIEAYMEKT